MAAALVFATACVYLGRWQWHRHEAKHARAVRIERHYDAGPVPLSAVLPGPGTPLAAAQEWTRVTVTGSYDLNGVLLVRNRANQGVFGYEVVVPLNLPDGASLLVDRGWLDNANTAAERPVIPATPGRPVSVTGWLRPGEPDLHRAPVPGQIASINLAQVAQLTGDRLYGAYAILDRERSLSDERLVRPTPLQRPDTDEGPHLAYALQWWGGAPCGIAFVIAGMRREARERRGLAPVARKRRIWDDEDE